MKSFLFTAIVLAAVTLVVAAVFFRSSRARDTLRFMRNAAWLYIAAIIALAAFRLWQS